MPDGNKCLSLSHVWIPSSVLPIEAIQQPTRREDPSLPRVRKPRSPGQRRSRQETPLLKWKVEGFSLVQGMWESRFMSVVVAKHLALNQGILYRALAHLSLA
ncbi:hypothetical protein LWI29_024346 [Acer saccharum]|uniref:Uncharacterized protein n=1 Tax=Acer saccharum TaxID=4024 RepID=A0AA39T5T9_ACESA|nr:hypothetical protein LWI29_024346 [Acer saccharum]